MDNNSLTLHFMDCIVLAVSVSAKYGCSLHKSPLLPDAMMPLRFWVQSTNLIIESNKNSVGLIQLTSLAVVKGLLQVEIEHFSCHCTLILVRWLGKGENLLPSIKGKQCFCSYLHYFLQIRYQITSRGDLYSGNVQTLPLYRWKKPIKMLNELNFWLAKHPAGWGLELFAARSTTLQNQQFGFQHFENLGDLEQVSLYLKVL